MSAAAGWARSGGRGKGERAFAIATNVPQQVAHVFPGDSLLLSRLTESILRTDRADELVRTLFLPPSAGD